MNEYLKYIYVALVLAIIIIVIVLFVRLKNLMIKLSKTKDKCSNIVNDVDTVKNKTQEIKDTKNSWQFFINIYVVFFILKQTIKEFKKMKKTGMKAAFALTCINNAAKIEKMI